MGGVPAAYADAWARLQIQKPMRVSDAEWRQAIDDAGRFLDQRGSLAVELGWTAGDLFDVPRIDGACGLAWWLRGRTVTALGHDHAAAGEPAYDLRCEVCVSGQESCKRPTSRSVSLEVDRQFRCFLLAPRDALFPLLFPAPRRAFHHQRMDLLDPDKLQPEINVSFLMVEPGSGRR